MDPKRFIACINRLQQLQGVTITFKSGKDSISSLRRIKGLGAGASEQELFVIEAVLASNDWQKDRNRTLTFWNMSRIDDRTLADIARDIEAIKTSPHLASDLMTGRKFHQRDAANQLIIDILNQGIIDEISSWGASIDGRFAEFDGLPAIEFAIKNRQTQNIIVLVAVDGWSGRYSVAGEWGDQRFSDVQGVRERIYSAFTDAMNKATAV